jgi:hypothetical protein
MQTALHITTKVPPGNRIEVQLPSGSEGQEVNIFIVLSTSPFLNQENLAAQLARMAEDADVQAELSAINTEFAVTQMDGLEIE